VIQYPAIFLFGVLSVEKVKVRVIKPFYYSFSLDEQRLLKENEKVYLNSDGIDGLLKNGFVKRIIMATKKVKKDD